MSDEENGNGINRRFDIGGKFISGSITIIIAVFMFFLGIFCNTLNGRVDEVTKKAYGNEKDIGIIKKDNEKMWETLNEIKFDIKEIKKAVKN